MTEPDTRWARVEGGITRPDHMPPNTQKVTIEVIGPTGHRIGQSILISDQERSQAYVDPLPYVLDKMVTKLDEALHA